VNAATRIILSGLSLWSVEGPLKSLHDFIATESIVNQAPDQTARLESFEFVKRELGQLQIWN
jgi:hypothetical protein